jgi:hypothetical protein
LPSSSLSTTTTPSLDFDEEVCWIRQRAPLIHFDGGTDVELLAIILLLFQQSFQLLDPIWLDSESVGVAVYPGVPRSSSTLNRRIIVAINEGKGEALNCIVTSERKL